MEKIEPIIESCYFEDNQYEEIESQNFLDKGMAELQGLIQLDFSGLDSTYLHNDGHCQDLGEISFLPWQDSAESNGQSALIWSLEQNLTLKDPEEGNIPEKISYGDGSILATGTAPYFSEDSTRSNIDSTEKTFYSEFVKKTYSFLAKRQQEIDEGNFVDRSKGRKRKNPYRTTAQTKQLIKEILKKKIREVLRMDGSRSDSIPTMLYRRLYDIPYDLIQECSSMSKYKSSNMDSYIFSFLESYVSFTSLIHLDEFSLVETFSEFSMLCFPISKWKSIIKALREEDCKEKFCKKLERMLAFRNETSKRKLKMRFESTQASCAKEFSAPPSCLESIFSLSVEILSQDEFASNPIAAQLIRFAQDFSRNP